MVIHKSISDEEESHFSDLTHRKFEFVRTEIFGDCPHAGTVATPYSLCEEMVAQLPDLNDKRVLVMFNPEFYMTVISKYPRARIVMLTGSEEAYMRQYENGFKGIEKMILVDPFDVDDVERKINNYLVLGQNSWILKK